jgi:hypothetical protein
VSKDILDWLSDHFDHAESAENNWCYECDEPLQSRVCDEPFDPDDLPPEAFMEFPDDDTRAADAGRRED